MKDIKTLKEIVTELEQQRMRCNCDLDNWQPEMSTGHSWVCRIHKSAREIYRNQPSIIFKRKEEDGEQE